MSSEKEKEKDNKRNKKKKKKIFKTTSGRQYCKLYFKQSQIKKKVKRKKKVYLVLRLN